MLRDALKEHLAVTVKPTPTWFVLAVTLAMTTISCEEGSNSTDLDYVERMVINGIVEAGRTDVEVVITRTLRLDEVFTVERAVLADVTARAIDEAGSVFPFVYDTLGLYRATGLTLNPGQRIRLEAQWRGKVVEASTVIPYPVDLTSCRISADTVRGRGYFLETTVRMRPNETYGQTYEIRRSGTALEGGRFTEVVRLADSDVTGEARIVESYDFSLDPSDTVVAVVHSYDQPFYDFFITRGSNAPGYDDLLFRQTGGPINWNVSGDGIGLFIGHATLRKRVLP